MLPSLPGAPPSFSLGELYTSQGCSSCPPAEEALRQYQEGSYPDTHVLLSFHVDYWNYLGWKDPFAKAEFSARQRLLAAERGWRRIYTPQWVTLDSTHQVGPRSPQLLAKSLTQAARPASVTLTGAWGKSPDTRGVLRVEVHPVGPEVPEVQLEAFWLGHGCQTKIPAGENSGTLAKESFVVLEALAPVSPEGRAALFRARSQDPSRCQSFEWAILAKDRGRREWVGGRRFRVSLDP